MDRVTSRSFCFHLAMEQIGLEGTTDRAGERDGVRDIKWASVLSLSCQLKAASYLLWEYSEACLHLELYYLL